MPVEPPATVLAAFGLTSRPVPLGGGQGGAWRVGGAVLKPLDAEPVESAWTAELFEALPLDGFRVPRPRRAADGSLHVAGWAAWEAVEGGHEPRWLDIIEVGEAFHAALAAVPRPAFLDTRTDRWSVADRVAWGERRLDGVHVEHLDRLRAVLRPVSARSQLVHGDLTGNVLFAPGLPPAVIDFSPYWRPTGWASAVVVSDALTWQGADESILDRVTHVEDFDQLLVRAVIYRAVTDRLFPADEPLRPADPDPYRPVVELVCRLAGC